MKISVSEKVNNGFYGAKNSANTTHPVTFSGLNFNKLLNKTYKIEVDDVLTKALDGRFMKMIN